MREYAGGWSDYAAARERARAQQYAAFEDSQERRREVEALLHAAATRRVPAAGSSPMRPAAPTGAGRRRSSGKVRQAERALERIEQVEKPYEPWQLHLSLAAAQRPGDRVASLEGAVGERGSFRLGPVDLDLAPGERVAVTGRNGSGKSTLLALLLGELPPRGRAPRRRPVDRARRARPAARRLRRR